MNIKEAKKQVKYTVSSYLTKNEFGEYCIPVIRQRPMFLVGPPGIGKTEIMSQVASELGVALVSYSMTHHTRQSALGLPFIQTKEYDGQECRTTEYTMSEIIASMYDSMAESGLKEGILFLDEINCISETLAPSMLQFLQNKTFGRHRIPEGWVVITAGNPPEYNNSVKDFDLATQDRLASLSIEPDFDSWYEYAEAAGAHGAILAYLNVHQDDFYSIRTVLEGREFVTARGWMDLSEIIQLYEMNNLPVDLNLINQYIRDERIARDFSIFYDLFFRYRKEYRIMDILDGKGYEEALALAHRAKFDETLAVIQQINDALKIDFRLVYENDRANAKVLELIKENREALAQPCEEAEKCLRTVLEETDKDIAVKKSAGLLSQDDASVCMRTRNVLSEMAELLADGVIRGEMGEAVIKSYLGEMRAAAESRADQAGSRLKNAFEYIDAAYGDREMLVFVTGLMRSRYSVNYITEYGSEEYRANMSRVQLDRREKELLQEIDKVK